MLNDTRGRSAQIDWQRRARWQAVGEALRNHRTDVALLMLRELTSERALEQRATERRESGRAPA